MLPENYNPCTKQILKEQETVPPLLSVAIAAYNHEKYISQAIEGVLRQKTNFSIELIIGEDCSTDKTREICLSYQEKFPETIKVLCPERNLGAHENFVVIFSRCRGKYTALCEGDDYWTDCSKLQKQVDFLEANPDYAICFHAVTVIYEDETRSAHLSPAAKPNDTTVFEDLAKENFIPTPSCVFRNALFEKYPEWYYEVSLGDWILNLLVAQHGKIKYIDEAMGVYRIHGQGAWGKNAIQKRLLDSARVVENCRRYFHPRGRSEFTQTLKDTYRQLGISLFPLFENGDYQNFRRYFYKIVESASNIPPRMLAALVIRYFLSYLPFLRDVYKTAKSRVS